MRKCTKIHNCEIQTLNLKKFQGYRGTEPLHLNAYSDSYMAHVIQLWLLSVIWLRVLLGALWTCVLLWCHRSHTQQCSGFFRRKTEDNNVAGEAYFNTDSKLLEDMVTERKRELQSECIIVR